MVLGRLLLGQLRLLIVLFACILVPVRTMVEGHSVHRVATRHRQRLLGKAFCATSPNGRFTDGAKAIHNKEFYRIEAVGKNLFCFFRSSVRDKFPVVVHVHFGMAGNWAVYQGSDEEVPAPTATNRLRLVHAQEALTADLSAMTVNHGGMDLYESKRSKLGQDPLRDDADVELLWTKVKKSKKSIGALIMDQSFFTGPGNIYRAEILFKAGIHPDVPGRALERDEFDRIWQHTVSLLQRGYQTGSILTVDPDEAQRLGNPRLRRYIYNTRHCPRCQSRIHVWDIASRTCYACPQCQPKKVVVEEEKKETKKKSRKAAAPVVTPEKKQECVPFNSHCARESVDIRLQQSGPERLTVKEIQEQLVKLVGVEGIPKNLRKAGLVKLLEDERAKVIAVQKEVVQVVKTNDGEEVPAMVASVSVATTSSGAAMVSSETAAAEKAMAHESLAVEHIAELAPAQARRARAQARKMIQLNKDEETTPASTAAPSSPRGRKRRRFPAK